MGAELSLSQKSGRELHEPEEDNDAGLVGPELGKRDLGPIRG